MTATSLGLALILAQSSVGWQGGTPLVVESAYPTSCGLPSCGVVREILRLQKSPRWRDREHAASVLRHVDWRRHPEVLGALAFSLLHDPAEEVREEAAESLSRLGACAPVVHSALQRAATTDPDRATRRWALRGLRSLPTRCVAACRVCQTNPPGLVSMPEPIAVDPAPATTLENPAAGTELEPIEPPLDDERRPRAEPSAPGDLEGVPEPSSRVPALSPSVEDLAPLREPESPSERSSRDALKPLPDLPQSSRREPPKPRPVVVSPGRRVAGFFPWRLLPRVGR